MRNSALFSICRSISSRAFAITSADDVPPHALQAELTALGNDGTFFDDRMEHADD